MSEFNGESLETVTVEYDEDEEVEVKYEPFDSELELESSVREPVPGPSSRINESSEIKESVTLRCEWGCVTYRKNIEQINDHLIRSHSPLDDGMNSFIKNEPLDDNSDPSTPGTHDFVNTGQKQCKVLDFDTGLCKQGCKLCEKCVQELKTHLKLNHPQLQSQPTYDSDLLDLALESTNEPSTEKSTTLGPLKTIDFAGAGEKDAKIKNRTQTSKRAGYPEEGIAIQPSSSRSVKKSRPISNRSDQNKSTVIPTVEKRRTRRPYGQNSDTEIKSKDSESEGKSSNEIRTEVEPSELNLNYDTSLGEKVDSSESHEINLTDHVSHTGGREDITQTGDFKRQSHLTTHMLIHTGENPFTCVICEKRFTRKWTLSSHMLVHTEEKRFRCSNCEKSFKRQAHLTTHMLIHTGEKPYTCDKCGMGFKSKSQLTVHMVTHSEEKPFRCVKCEKSFKRRDQLISHMRVHTEEKDFNCKTCEKSFRRLSDLTVHMAIHSEERPFECSFCEASFKRQRQLTSHMLIHSEENGVKCSICEKSLKRQGLLTSHMLIHTGEYPFTCMICEKRFRRKCNLSSHMVVHNEEKPFKCFICEKSFKRANQLRIHMRIHTGETAAQKSFISRRKLNMPMTSHTGEKLFSCERCGIGFTVKENLTTHLANYCPERQFKCNTCEMTFKISAHLTQHERIHTGGEFVGN